MAGLVPAIHVFYFADRKTWIPGTRPGMTDMDRRSALNFREISNGPRRSADFVEEF
jgi:hypothetical protein